MTTPTLVCTGREYDGRGRPVDPDAPPCGRQYPRRRYEREASYHLRARVDGWAIGPADTTPRHVMCPACRRPGMTPAMRHELEGIMKR